MNEQRRKVLGRGISSLIPHIPATKPTFNGPESAILAEDPRPGEQVHQVAVDQIQCNPRQPRRRFSEKALEELAHSVREYGVLQPLLGRRTDRGVELIAGERRLRAARLAGLSHVPVLFRKGGGDREQLEMALVENLQREDLNPIEEARGYEGLSREFGLTQDEISQRVGKERSTVSNQLRLLKLSRAVQDLLAAGALSIGHARALIPLEDSRRQEVLAQRIEKEGLSVRKIEALVREMTKENGRHGRRAVDQVSRGANLRHLADELQRALGTRVEVAARGKGGQIRIHYFNLEDLTRLCDRLLGKTENPLKP